MSRIYTYLYSSQTRKDPETLPRNVNKNKFIQELRDEHTVNGQRRMVHAPGLIALMALMAVISFSAIHILIAGRQPWYLLFDCYDTMAEYM